MTEYWKAVEAVTGYPIADLPDFVVDTLPATLSRPETFTGTLPLPSADNSSPVNWVSATDPWSVALLRIDDVTGAVVGSGYVYNRVRSQSDVVTVSLVTPEGILDRRYTLNYAPTNVGQLTVMGQLVALFAATPSVVGLNPWPATFNQIGPETQNITRTYLTSDRRTVLTNLTELNGIIGGAEFTVTWQHLNNPERWLPVFNAGARIGTPVTPGLAPNVTFELGGTISGGQIVDFAYTEDFSTFKAANYVTQYSPALTNTGLPPADQSLTYFAGPRRLELDYTSNPSSSIVTTADLLAHAQQTLPLLQNGARSLALSIRGGVFPQYGVDFQLGDDVGYRIGGLDASNKDTVPSLPGGISGIARVVGVRRQQPDAPNSITTPILVGI